MGVTSQTPTVARRESHLAAFQEVIWRFLLSARVIGMGPRAAPQRSSRVGIGEVAAARGDCRRPRKAAEDINLGCIIYSYLALQFPLWLLSIVSLAVSVWQCNRLAVYQCSCRAARARGRRQKAGLRLAQAPPTGPKVTVHAALCGPEVAETVIRFVTLARVRGRHQKAGLKLAQASPSGLAEGSRHCQMTILENTSESGLTPAIIVRRLAPYGQVVSPGLQLTRSLTRAPFQHGTSASATGSLSRVARSRSLRTSGPWIKNIPGRLGRSLT